MQAQFFQFLEKNRIKCTLCPHFCVLSEGQTGLCGVRKNHGGELVTLNYGVVSALHVDSIEKKPLYHFYPSKSILSVGSLGCNLFCSFCQNWEIAHPEKKLSLQTYLPDEIVKAALKTPNNIGIAYTYNEPIVFYEFMFDTAKLAKHEKLKTVMVTNGFINPEFLSELFPFIDAFSVDLKGFSDVFYRKTTKSKLLPVLENLKIIYHSGRHLEITNLIIPGLNDNEQEFREMIKWIVENLSDKVVLHLSRYFPQYKLNIPATDVDIMMKLYKIAREYLLYVYLGNLHSSLGSDTYCPTCGIKVISRMGYETKLLALEADGKCINCSTKIITN